MRVRLTHLLAVAGTLLATLPASAHHATQAAFDKDKPVTIKGTLTRVQWVNPHVRWYMDVKDEKTGKVETWTIMGAGPGAFRANGVTAKGTFKTGDVYSATVAHARDGSNAGYVMTWVMPDGTKFDFWHQYGEK